LDGIAVLLAIVSITSLRVAVEQQPRAAGVVA
jgi:hypothetical protein